MKFFRFSQNETVGNRISFLQLLINLFEALVILLLVFVLMLSFETWFSLPTLSLLFFPAIAFNAWRGGFRIGILSAVFAAISIDYYFFLPNNIFHITELTAILQFILILFEGIFLSFLIDTRRHRDTFLNYLRREREYKKRILEIEKKNDAYVKEIRSRDEFLSIASHELKTPLTSMLLPELFSKNSYR